MDSKNPKTFTGLEDDQSGASCLLLTASCILLVLRAQLNDNDITAQGA
jgi:hypothetical protein